jgi:Tfp pilus assembly protein PilF
MEVGIYISIAGILITLGTILVRITMNVTKATNDVAKEATEKANKVSNDLAAHKLHVSEKYVSKDDMREAMAPMTHALEGVKSSMDSMAGRIDRVIERQSPPPRTRS